MNPEQIAGLARAGLAAFGGYAAAKGWIAPSDVDWLAGGVSAAVIGGWSWWSKRPPASA